MSMKFDLPPYLYLCNNENYKKNTCIVDVLVSNACRCWLLVTRMPGD